VPVLIVLAALVSVLVIGSKTGDYSSGFNIGIDFSGGTQMTIILGDGAEGDAYKQNSKIITDIVQKNRENAPTISYLQRVEENGESAIRIKYKNTLEDGNDMNALNEAIRADIYTQYGENNTEDPYFVTYRSTSATATSSLLKDAILAAGIALIAILLYIVIRFELLSGVSAVIALLHDVIIMFAFTVLFRIQINSSYVAAVITIISYSINNTIIVFDRVRERKRLYDKRAMNYREIADDSILMTLSRTLFTSATTIIMVVFLSILGVATMREFTLPIMFGLIAGTYSSMFIAAPTWAMINEAIVNGRNKKYAALKANK
jgi:protein-export membrane protein SecF